MTQTQLRHASTARVSGRTSAAKHLFALRVPRALPNAHSVVRLADTDEVKTHALEQEPVQWKLQGGSHASAPLLQNHEHVTVTHGCYVLHGPARVVKVGPALLRAELQPGSWVEIMGAPQSPMYVLLPEVMTYGEREQSDGSGHKEDDETISSPTNSMPATRAANQQQNALPATHQPPSTSCDLVDSATANLANPVHKASVQRSHQTDTDCPPGRRAVAPDQRSHWADTQPSRGHPTMGPGRLTGPECQSGNQAKAPDHRSHPEHPAALKLHAKYCLLAAEHLELRGTFALGSCDGPVSVSFNSMDLPPAIHATDDAGACSKTGNVVDSYVLKGKPAADATVALKPTVAGVVVAAPATEDCGMREGQVATASGEAAIDRPVPAAGATLAAADRILQAAAKIGANPCGSYSDSSPASCPGVMHHKGRVLISVHALPQDGGFCLDLGTGSVMSHPLNCCCGEQ